MTTIHREKSRNLYFSFNQKETCYSFFNYNVIRAIRFVVLCLLLNLNTITLEFVFQVLIFPTVKATLFIALESKITTRGIRQHDEVANFMMHTVMND